LDVKVNASAAVADAERYVSGAFGPAKRVRRQQKLREIMPKASFRDFRRYFGTWKTGKVLLGTAGSWAFLDVAFVK
jgi:PHS family inorganic phosphate transporter-like MFS transporter